MPSSPAPPRRNPAQPLDTDGKEDSLWRGMDQIMLGPRSSIRSAVLARQVADVVVAERDVNGGTRSEVMYEVAESVRL